MLRASKPEFKPFPLMGQVEMPHCHGELSELGLSLGAALSQISVQSWILREAPI